MNMEKYLGKFEEFVTVTVAELPRAVVVTLFELLKENHTKEKTNRMIFICHIPLLYYRGDFRISDNTTCEEFMEVYKKYKITMQKYVFKEYLIPSYNAEIKTLTDLMKKYLAPSYNVEVEKSLTDLRGKYLGIFEELVGVTVVNLPRGVAVSLLELLKVNCAKEKPNRITFICYGGSREYCYSHGSFRLDDKTTYEDFMHKYRKYKMAIPKCVFKEHLAPIYNVELKKSLTDFLEIVNKIS